MDAGGETLAIPERVVVAPGIGAFRPFRSVENQLVSAGQPLGVVEGLRRTVIVRSPFAGRFMGMLALEGERVRPGQAVAWLRQPDARAPNLRPIERPSVLVVDDDRANRMLLSKLLERFGCQPTSAADGRVGLEALEKQSFDVVLLDIVMPDLDGFAVLEVLAGKERRPPVIMVSSLEEAAGVVRCMDLGAQDYLFKPVDATLLQARVKACLSAAVWREADVTEPDVGSPSVAQPGALPRFREGDLLSLEGRRVSVALRDGSRIDDCELVSAGRRGLESVWIYSNGSDQFVPLPDVVDVWEVLPQAV